MRRSCHISHSILDKILSLMYPLTYATDKISVFPRATHSAASLKIVAAVASNVVDHVGWDDGANGFTPNFSILRLGAPTLKNCWRLVNNSCLSAHSCRPFSELLTHLKFVFLNFK